MVSPLDTRKKPSGVKVHLSTGKGVDIAWSDSHTSHYDFAYLREKCPCATCDDERKKKSDISSRAGAGPALPMFKPRVTARQAKAVGQYAIQLEFSDGHSTGIYSFDFLRTVCPCSECAQAFRSATGDPGCQAI